MAKLSEVITGNRRQEIMDILSSLRRKDIETESNGHLGFKVYQTGRDNYAEKVIFKFNTNPFGNCQVFSARLFYRFLDALKFAPLKGLTKAELMCLLYLAGDAKRIIAVDINEKYYANAKEFFSEAERIIIDSPYISSNESNMHFMLVQLFK